MRVVGIDPGATGALAFLDIHNGLTLKLECADLPILSRGGRKHLDAPELARLIDAAGPIAAAILEQGGVRPQNGRVGAAAFWLGVGEIRGILAANFIPLEVVTPSAWKRAMRVVGDKDASRIRAGEVFPRWSAQWPRKKDHGRAEAALIALHGASRLPVRQTA